MLNAQRMHHRETEKKKLITSRKDNHKKNQKTKQGRCKILFFKTNTGGFVYQTQGPEKRPRDPFAQVLRCTCQHNVLTRCAHLVTVGRTTQHMQIGQDTGSPAIAL